MLRGAHGPAELILSQMARTAGGLIQKRTEHREPCTTRGIESARKLKSRRGR